MDITWVILLKGSNMNPQILEIDGWMAPEELTWLYETARKVPQDGLIVEIGAWKGRSSAALYEGAENEKAIVSIDTWKGQDDLPDHQIAQKIDMWGVYIRNMKQLGLIVYPIQRGFENDNRSWFFISDSVAAAAEFPDQSIDWLFIDGDHRKTGADIDAFLPKMKPDSLITGHDYFCFYETIQQELHKRFYIHELHHSIWVRYVGDKPSWY